MSNRRRDWDGKVFHRSFFAQWVGSRRLVPACQSVMVVVFKMAACAPRFHFRTEVLVCCSLRQLCMWSSFQLCKTGVLTAREDRCWNMARVDKRSDHCDSRRHEPGTGKHRRPSVSCCRHLLNDGTMRTIVSVLGEVAFGYGYGDMGEDFSPTSAFNSWWQRPSSRVLARHRP